MNRAVFFDRDGTLMEEVGYCGDPAKVRLLAGATEAVRRLRGAGYCVVLVTNQSGIGRGYFGVPDFEAVQMEFFRQLGERFDGIYYCPDAPDAMSSRRKPAADMLIEAARDLDLDLAQCFMVGDREGDVQAGRNAGCRSILVLTGNCKHDASADYIAANLADTVAWILEKNR